MNRAMQGKVVKANTQRHAFAEAEGGKSFYMQGLTKDQQRALLASIDMTGARVIAPTPKKTPVDPVRTECWRPLRAKANRTELRQRGLGYSASC